MNLLLLLDMAAAGRGDEVAVQVGEETVTAGELLSSAWTGATEVAGASALAYVGTNGLAFPIGLFAAAAAGVPFVPLNYRLSHDQLGDLLAPLGDVVVVAEGDVATALATRGHRVLDTGDFVARARAGSDAHGEVPAESEDAAVLLYTSGTTSAPKAAVLRHRHLTSYVIGTVEFGSADPSDAALVSVPAYHVAGLANLLSNLYLGRRIVYLPQFDAEGWVRTVQAEAITNAMLVPTMLARVCDVLERDADSGTGGLPSLRSLSYGGARTPATVLQRVMHLLPDVGLTNAYGLTETSSTIAVLGPDDHAAARAGDPVAVARLGSAGRVLPTIEVEIRGPDGAPVPGGETGEIWVRGEQVSGEYREASAAPTDDEATPDHSVGAADSAQGGRVGSGGWFPTRDRGFLDDDGYLFVEGRSDDTIIRGGENVAPAEIEEVLLRHPDVAQCAVVGLPDDEWGQRIAAVIVPHPGAALDTGAVRDFVRHALRSSKTPDQVSFVESLPYTETGKLLRRVVRDDLLAAT